LRVVIEYVAHAAIDTPIFGLAISREDEVECLNTHTTAGPARLEPGQRGRVVADIERVDLVGGSYFVDVGIYEAAWAYAYDYHWQAYPLDVESPTAEKGIVQAPVRWTAMRG
jgi:lipopolysaccharide transport system ATP-binding protein